MEHRFRRRRAAAPKGRNTCRKSEMWVASRGEERQIDEDQSTEGEAAHRLGPSAAAGTAGTGRCWPATAQAASSSGVSSGARRWVWGWVGLTDRST